MASATGCRSRLSSGSLVTLVAALCVMLSVVFVSTADAFMFDLGANKQVCFTEEVPSNSEISLSFRAAPAYAQFVDVKLSDSEDNVLWNVQGKDKEFTRMQIARGGDYALCFYSRTTPGTRVSEDVMRAITVDFSIGSEAQDYAQIAADRNLRPMEVRLQAIEDTVRGIHLEYVYYREKEAAMRNTNEHMSAKVMWITIVLIVFFMAFSIWQLRHLKKYFKKKRMID